MNLMEIIGEEEYKTGHQYAALIDLMMIYGRLRVCFAAGLFGPLIGDGLSDQAEGVTFLRVSDSDGDFDWGTEGR
jgi:hypothetical protein